MTIEMWTAFVCAATVVLIIPGPTIIMVISQAVIHGRGAVIPLVIGVVLGDFTAMTFSVIGLGAIMAASAALFGVMKWIGAGYLIYLGVKHWRTEAEKYEHGFSAPDLAGKSVSKRAFIVTALNPKGIAFFVAFLPQFVNPESRAIPQFLILGTTFFILAGINVTLYAMSAGRLRDAIQTARAQRWFNRCGGSALIGAGILTAAMRRAS